MPDDNRWNRTGHILLGIAAALVPGLDYYAAQREINQTPCENDDHPAIYIWLDSGWRTVYSDSIDEVPSQFRPNVEPYWSSVRVLDSLHDSREVAIGKEIGRWVAWAWVAAAAVAVFIAKWALVGGLAGAWLGVCALAWGMVKIADS